MKMNSDNQSSKISCQSEQQSFRVVRTLGKSTHATCYEVHFDAGEESPRVMACKAIENDAKGYHTIEKENAILKDLDHKNILRWIDFYRDDVKTYIFTELCELGDMYDFVMDRYPLPDFLNRRFLFQSIEAIEYIHNRGIIHRDIKPDNFFITADLKIKLGDFGLSLKADCSGRERNRLSGTCGYLSPEIAKGIRYGTATDIWSFGCVVYFVLAKRLLIYKKYATFTKFKIQNSIDRHGIDLIKKLLRVDPRERLEASVIKSHPFFDGLDKDDDKDETCIGMDKKDVIDISSKDEQDDQVVYFTSNIPKKCLVIPVGECEDGEITFCDEEEEEAPECRAS